MHGAAQGAAQSSTLDGVCLNVLELACLKFSGLVLANFELFDKRLQGATSMDATKQTRWAYDAWRACSRFHRLRTQVGKKKSQAAMNAQQPLNHIVAPETEAKQESMTVIVDVTRIPAPPWPAPLEQPALLEQFGHVGQPIYGTDGTDGHFDLPIFGPLLAESILGQVAESILGQVAGLILGPVVAEYKLGPVAAEPPVGHNVGPSIGQDGQPSNGQVDQPIDGQGGQPGTDGTEPSTGQVDQPINGHDGQRGTDGTKPSKNFGVPIYGQDGQRGTDVTAPSTGNVGQPTLGPVAAEPTIGHVGHPGPVVAEPTIGQDVGQPVLGYTIGHVGQPALGPVVGQPTIDHGHDVGLHTICHHVGNTLMVRMLANKLLVMLTSPLMAKTLLAKRNQMMNQTTIHPTYRRSNSSHAGILEKFRGRCRYEVSLSDPGLFIYRNRRFIGCVPRGECASNGLPAIAISVGTVIKKRCIFTSTESRISSYDLQLWKFYLCQNNFNFGASFGKLLNHASSV